MTRVLAVWSEYSGLHRGKTDVFWYYGKPCRVEGKYLQSITDGSNDSEHGYLTVNLGSAAGVERALLSGLQAQYPNAIVVDERDLR